MAVAWVSRAGAAKCGAVGAGSVSSSVTVIKRGPAVWPSLWWVSRREPGARPTRGLNWIRLRTLYCRNVLLLLAFASVPNWPAGGVSMSSLPRDEVGRRTIV